MGYPGAKYQAGLEPIDVVEVTAAIAIARLMGAAFAEVRPTSATLANLAVYTALTDPGDTIAVLPDWAGGHLSHHAVGVPSVRGLRVAPLPYDAERLDVDVDALDEFLGWEVPRLVVVGASLMLFPHRLTAIAEVVRGHGIPLLYDASHVAGLVAEGRFQDPLREGADLVTFSTYKSFGGPPGGVIVTNDAGSPSRSRTPSIRRSWPTTTSRGSSRSRPPPWSASARAGRTPTSASPTPGRSPRRWRRRASTCSAPGAASPSPTTSRSTSPAAARRLRAAWPRATSSRSEIGIPADPAGGIRLGTQAITRQGFVADDMPAIAAACAGALLHDTDVRAGRGRPAPPSLRPALVPHAGRSSLRSWP